MTTYVRSLLPRLGLLLFAVSLSQSTLLAQGFGTIVGTITDPAGAAIPSAKVHVSDDSTGTVRETVTNEQGYFVVPSLSPSTYTITIEASGFASSIRKGVVLQADESRPVNQALSLQQTTQTVEVRADAAVVNTVTGTVSEVVDQRRVEDLPLNGRNAASLLLVVAGAIPAPGTDADQGNTKTFPDDRDGLHQRCPAEPGQLPPRWRE